LIDGRTRALFSPFNREVGNPGRSRIRTFKEFEDFVALNNGVSRDVFTSVYDRKLNIDKIFMDLDGTLCYFALGKLTTYLWSIEEHPYDTFSGMKGFHLWLPLAKPTRRVEARDLEHATLSIIKSAGLIDKIGGHTSGLPIDSTTIGDVRQMARIPNTLRPPDNEFWCTWVPDTFWQWSPKKMYQWVQSPHYYSDFARSERDIFDFQTEDYEQMRDYLKERLSVETSIIVGENSTLSKESLFRWFEPFMAPSIAKSIVYDPEPQHKMRFIAAKALLQVGFPIDTILEKFMKCNWVDFDVEKTMYFLHDINRDRYIDKQWWRKEVKRSG
jgi:hypothetical protein